MASSKMKTNFVITERTNSRKEYHITDMGKELRN